MQLEREVASTSAALRKYGEEPDVVARNATIPDLHDAVISFVLFK